MDNRLEEKKSIIYLQYILITLIILECNSVYSQLYGIHYYIRAITIIMSSLITFFLMFKKIKEKKVKFGKKLKILILFDVICSLLLFIRTVDIKGRIIIILYFLMFFPTFISYILLLNKTEIKRLLLRFINVVVVLSIVSIIFWLFGPMLKFIEPYNQMKIIWGKPYTLMDNYYYMFFDSHQDVYWLTKNAIPRNMSIFGEAPMFSAVIVLAMLSCTYLYVNDRRRYVRKNILKKLILFLITIITTFSITGIIITLLLALFLLKNILNNLSAKVNRKIMIIFCIVLIVSIPFIIVIGQRKIATASASNRFKDFENGIVAFAQNPVLGKGIGHERDFENNPNSGYGYSNVIIPISTDGGVILLLFYLLPCLLLLIDTLKQKEYKYLMVIFVYVIILFTTAIQYRALLLSLLAFLYCFCLNNYKSGYIKKN